MNRLTEKKENGEYISYINDSTLCYKLGKLEDLMEKYSIPDIDYLEKCILFHDKYGELFERFNIQYFDKVLSAIMTGYYYKNHLGKIYFVDPDYYNITIARDKDDWYLHAEETHDQHYIEISGYKKDWALTKEELE